MENQYQYPNIYGFKTPQRWAFGPMGDKLKTHKDVMRHIEEMEAKYKKQPPNNQNEQGD